MDGASFTQRFPFLGNIGRWLMSSPGSPESKAAGAILHPSRTIGMPFRAMSPLNWAPGEPGEHRFLGTSDRLRFEAAIKALPYVSGGWLVAGPRQEQRSPSGKSYYQGYDLVDPQGDRWVITLSSFGSVDLKNLAPWHPKPVFPERPQGAPFLERKHW